MHHSLTLSLLLLIGWSVYSPEQMQDSSSQELSWDGSPHTIELTGGYFHSMGKIFNTAANMKYLHPQPLEKDIFARLDSIDHSLNPFNEASIIYHVNRNLPIQVDNCFLSVFRTAQTVSERTNGLYDITAAPLINLWGFGYEKICTPTPAAIDSIRAFVGYQKVHIEGRQVVKTDPRVQLNASSLAKGYAVDAVAELLEAKGIDHYMVEIGGEIRVKGLNPQRESWKIEIGQPIDDNTGKTYQAAGVIELEQGAVATSGNSFNYYLRDGKKYAHIINPRTGYPAESNMRSASIIHPSCIMADALATACMVMDARQAANWLKEIPEAGYILIYETSEGRLQTITSDY